MEYAMPIDNCDYMSMKYVGWQENNECIKKYFSQNTVKIISNKVTELLMGVNPQNRPILVPDKTICSVMSTIYYNFRPPTGDIYGRYNVPNGMGPEDYVQNMIDQVIEVIVSDVSSNLLMEENNAKLSIWTTVYGDFNEHGLRQVPPIKVRNKRPQPMQFMMNY